MRLVLYITVEAGDLSLSERNFDRQTHFHQTYLYFLHGRSTQKRSKALTKLQNIRQIRSFLDFFSKILALAKLNFVASFDFGNGKRASKLKIRFIPLLHVFLRLNLRSS